MCMKWEHHTFQRENAYLTICRTLKLCFSTLPNRSLLCTLQAIDEFGTFKQRVHYAVNVRNLKLRSNSETRSKSENVVKNVQREFIRFHCGIIVIHLSLATYILIRERRKRIEHPLFASKYLSLFSGSLICLVPVLLANDILWFMSWDVVV